MTDFLRKLFGRHQNPQPTGEDNDLERFYTNSEYELQVFELLVSAMNLPKRLLIIHGIGGVGKSTLLKMYGLSCRRHHISSALVASEEAPSPVNVLADWTYDLSRDGVTLPAFEKTLTHYRSLQAQVEAEAKKVSQTKSQLASTLGKAAAKTAIGMAASAIPVFGPMVSAFGGEGAEAFVDWLRGFLSKPDMELYFDPATRLDSDFINDLINVASRQRIVLMTDTYEQMTALDDWMRELARRLPQNVLLVIASRTVPDWERGWQGWMGKAEIVELKEMTPDDLRTLIHRYYAYIHSGDPDPKQVEAIIQFARGLPMVATTVVQLWVKYRVEDFQAVRPQVVVDLVDRLLEGVPQEIRPAFEAAAVLRYFNVEVLSTLLDGGNAEALYAELRRWPFIRSRREGLAVHGTMREMINEALHMRTPERFRTLHERAAAYYESRLEEATAEERERYISERLYHRVRSEEGSGMRMFQEMAEELTRYRMINRLRALLNDVNTYHLEQGNSLRWREYYNARLAHIEGYLDHVEEVYQAIAGNESIESKLRAYALCDWGTLLRLPQTNKQTDTEKSIQVIEQGLTLHPLDSKLVIALTDLSGAYRRSKHWEDALHSLEKARKFCSEHNDNYGVAYICNRQKYLYLDRGEWQLGFLAQKQGLEALAEVSEPFYLKSQLLGGLGIAWQWAGNYVEGERNLQEAIRMTKQIGEQLPAVSFLRDLGTIFGAQGKYEQADSAFLESSEILQRYPEYGAGFGVLLTFWGLTLLRKGELLKAEEYLNRGRNILEGSEKQNKWESFFTLIPMGELYELRHDWAQAESHYRQWLNLRSLGRYYFECSALVGLARVKYVQKEYAAIPDLLVDAEQLAQRYEYNEHLVSLRLIQGHLAWDSDVTVWGQGFDAALHFYQSALIHALRYNRFLLDEVLSGRQQGTLHEPIIMHCLEHDKEGRNMLLSLSDWWRNGTNDIGTKRPISVSPIPEAISLIEGERLARTREPGDGSLQQTVEKQLEQALVMFSS